MTERIETARLVLRKAAESDREAIWHNVWCDEALAATMLWEPTRTEEAARARMERTLAYQAKYDAFFVCLKETDEPIGFGGIREDDPGTFEETGICIAQAYQNRGYGKEVLCALLSLAFDRYGGERFLYCCFSENLPSAALCRSCGFTYTHTTRETRERDGYLYDCDHYELTDPKKGEPTHEQRTEYQTL